MSLVTAKTREGELGERLIRHPTAHVMAEVITNLFPGCSWSMAPGRAGLLLRHGLPDGAAISKDDFERIEAE